MDNIELLSLTIKQIVSEKGMSVFDNSKLFCAMIDDLVPQLVTERNILRRILNDSLLREIGNIQNVNHNVDDEWVKIKRKLIDCYGLRDDWCHTLILSFSKAFGEESWQEDILRLKKVDSNVVKFHDADSETVAEDSEKVDVKISVVGIGGAGNCFINRAINGKVTGIEFIAVNADESALSLCKAPKRILVGKKLTKGLGVAAKPELGEQVVEESIEDIRNAIRGSSIVFICCGMGGGMGTGGSPVIARSTREMGILTIGLVTTPFRFEAEVRHENAEMGIKELEKFVDALFIFSNDKILEMVDRKTTIPEGIKIIDGVFWRGVTAIMNLIDPTTYNYKSLEELKNIIKCKGHAHIGYATAKGKGKMIAALEMVKDSPWLEMSINDASQVIIYVLGDVSEMDVSYVARNIYGCKNFIYGAKYDSTMQNEVEIIMIAFEKPRENIGINKKEAEFGKRDITDIEKKAFWIPDFMKRK